MYLIYAFSFIDNHEFYFDIGLDAGEKLFYCLYSSNCLFCGIHDVSQAENGAVLHKG